MLHSDSANRLDPVRPSTPRRMAFWAIRLALVLGQASIAHAAAITLPLGLNPGDTYRIIFTTAQVLVDVNSAGAVAPAGFNGINEAGQFAAAVPTPAGFAGSVGYGINNLGQIVGSAFMTGVYDYSAFLHDPAQGATLLGFPLGSQPLDINDHGQIVGQVLSSNGQTASAFYYDPVSGFVDLGGMLGGSSSTLQDINNLGTAVGWFTSADIALPYTYSPATGIQYLPLPPGAISCNARDINDHGAIVGGCRTASDHLYAALYTTTLVSGYKSNRFNCLRISGKSFWKSDG